MKYKLHLIILVFFGTIACGGDLIAQSKSPAKFYLGEYFDLFGPIQKDMWAFSVSLARNKERAIIESKRNDLISTLQYYAEVVESDPNLDGDSLLRLGVLAWLNTVNKVLQIDYVKLVGLKSQAQSSVLAMRTYLKNVEISSEKLQKANEDLDVVVHSFAKRHSLNIIEIDTRKTTQLKRTNNAFKYYHGIYLTFFESFFQENNFNKAINSKQYDAVKMEQKKLLNTVQQSLDALNKQKAYEGDKSLKQAGITILHAYKESAQEFGDSVLAFYAIQTHFDSVSKVVVNLVPEKRSQEHVLAYNAAAKAYNAAMISFENESKHFNVRRRKELSDWNNAVNDFITKHAY